MNIKTHRFLGVFLIAVVTAAMGSVVYRNSRPTGSDQSDAKQLIPWRTDLDAARQEAIAAKKPLFIEFSAGWCPDCQQMRSQTWTQANVAQAMNAFIPVQIDFDSHPDLVKQFGASSIPAIYIVDPGTETIIKQSRGDVLSPDELLAWVK